MIRVTPERALWPAVWIGALAAATALTGAAHGAGPLPGDHAIAEWFQDAGAPGNAVSRAVRAITETEVVLIAGSVASVALWLRGYRRHALALAAALLALAVLQPLVKEIADRPRPDPSLVDVRAGFSSPSFPSGHVMSGTVLYGALAYLAAAIPLPGRLRGTVLASCIAIIALGGPANVYMGVHWPSDVAGGWLWALVILIPAYVVIVRSKRG